ncbi:MAG: tetratricopeptide repeat protein [Nitrospirae bacterium]|nr:tetratricopeptide repeat protein [Nitrospirota bacterium]
MTSDVLISISMGRDRDISRIENILKNASSGRSLSNSILIGPKGIGKTHILNIIYRSIRGNRKINDKIADLKERFTPVLFSEEEYVSGDITKFVLTILRYLPNSKDNKPISIPKEFINLTRITEKERAAAVSFLKTFKEKTGKILLLLIDNFNDIIEKFTREDQSALRDVLMTTDSVLIIGAAPTLFDGIINYDKPFYNFFEVIRLRDFSYKETTELLYRFAAIEGNDELIKKLENSKSKIEAIHRLTGGNPRLIQTLFNIVVKEDAASVEDMLIKLLDNLSSYFRERMRDLPNQQMEIIDVMARAETLLTPTEIAAAAHLPVNTVNSQLTRLEKSGYVKNVTPKRKRTVFYDINERLFSLWRQMRVDAGRKRLSLIVRFYEIWFSKEELQLHLDKILKEITEKCADECQLSKCMDNLYYIKEAIPEFKGKGEALIAYQKGNYKATIVILKKHLMKNPNDYEALLNLGAVYLMEGQPDKAIAAYNKALEINPNDYEASSNLGALYSSTGEHDKAIEACNKALEINSKYDGAWYNLGNAYSATGRPHKAIAAYIKALEFDPENYRTLNNLGVIYLIIGQHKKGFNALLSSIKIQPNEKLPLNGMFYLFYITFVHEAIKGNAANALYSLQKMIEVSYATILKKEMQDFFVNSFKEIAKSKKYNFLRQALDEVKKTGEDELYELLRPFDIIVKYYETKDENVIERLKPEVRLIVDEIMKEIEGAADTESSPIESS